nr:ATP-dependent RNA helicase TDRD9-like [Cherax quadricarinatus]
MNMMAVECILAELKPVSKYTNGMWESKATDWFKTHVQNMNFTVQIYSIVHGILRVELLKDEFGTLVSINQTLISMGYAVKADEFFLSKRNHELRALYSSQVEETSVNSDSRDLSTYSCLSNFLKGPEKFTSKAVVGFWCDIGSFGVGCDTSKHNFDAAPSWDPATLFSPFLPCS